MKFKGKEIKILYVKFQHKETDGNRQEQAGTDRIRKKLRKKNSFYDRSGSRSKKDFQHVLFDF